MTNIHKSGTVKKNNKVGTVFVPGVHKFNAIKVNNHNLPW